MRFFKATILLFTCIQLISCDNSYDLSKDINTDLSFGKEFSVPVGSTDKIMITRIIKPSESLKIGADGVFNVLVSGSTEINIDPVKHIVINGITPMIKNVNIPLFSNLSMAKLKKAQSESLKLETSALYSIDVLLPAEVESIDGALFNNDEFSATLEVHLPDLPSCVDKITMTDFTVTFPDIFILKNGKNYQTESPFDLSTNSSLKVITLPLAYIKIPDNDKSKYLIKKSDGLHFIMNDAMYVSASCNATLGSSLPMSDDQIKFSFKYYSNDDAVLKKICGQFSTNTNVNTEIAINDIPSFLKDDNTHFSISSLNIDLSFNNPTLLKLECPLAFKTIKNNKNLGGPTQINIEAKQSGINNFIISNVSSSVPNGYTEIICPELTNLLPSVPDKFVVNSSKVKLVSDNLNQYFELDKAYNSKISYEFSVPFNFKDLAIQYTDSITDLLSDLKDISNKTDELTVAATGLSTIPLDLRGTVKLYDANHNELKNIEVDLSNFKFNAAKGDGTETSSPLYIKLANINGLHELEQLETIVYTISADSESGLELNSNQYLLIKDIIAKITKGINLTL